MTITAASIAFGLVLVVIAGFLNGSWNASFSPDHGLAVGRRHTTVVDDDDDEKQQQQHQRNRKRRDDDLSYHQAWILFQVYATIINVPICLYWAGGPSRVRYIVEETPDSEIIWVCVFSVLWGIGSIGFGLACKIAGVGLGTNLCMGVIMILGTFLPLCIDEAIETRSGIVVISGLVLCCVGLAFSVLSMQSRDKGTQKTNDRQQQQSVAEQQQSVAEQQQQESNDKNDDDDAETTTEYSTFYKIAVCFVAGVFASQLQFAFVFGDTMISLAEKGGGEGYGSTPPSGTSATIWLFAISLGAPVSVVYGLWGMHNQEEEEDEIEIENLYRWKKLLRFRCPWYRHFWILSTTSIPWVCQIHLYGFSTTQLPEKLAAAVAWPILMMVTVITGMLWSIFLGEWTGASRDSKNKLYLGLFALTAGVAIIMSSVTI